MRRPGARNERLTSLSVPDDKLYELGALVLSGKIPNRPASRSEAFALWRRVLARNPHHLEAKFSLGTALLLSGSSGGNVDADGDTMREEAQPEQAEGVRFLVEAANGGHAWAMANLAQHLLRSMSSETSRGSSLRRSANLFVKSWQTGRVPVAPFNLYQIYSALAKQQTQPAHAQELVDESERWLTVAADELQDATALYQIACLLQQRNAANWASYMKRAADAGVTMAQHNLAVEFLGQGRALEAIRYFRAASNSGFLHSTFNLGLVYLQGAGEVAPDPASAHVYFSQTYVSGDEALKQQVLQFMAPNSANPHR